MPAPLGAQRRHLGWRQRLASLLEDARRLVWHR
jgi:hypothetical protein